MKLSKLDIFWTNYLLNKFKYKKTLKNVNLKQFIVVIAAEAEKDERIRIESKAVFVCKWLKLWNNY